MKIVELTPYAGWVKNQQIENLLKRGVFKNVKFIKESYEKGKIDEVDYKYLLSMNQAVRAVIKEYESGDSDE